jgi:hypothetical protein
MEILKFSEPPKRSSRSASARKNGLMPMVTFGIAVLVLGGMSTTLAGTINLNGTGNSVEFGQGVVTTAACDTSISVSPTSEYDTQTGFYVSSVRLSNIGTSTSVDGAGCLDKTFTIKAYDAELDPMFFDAGNSLSSIFVTIADTATYTSGVLNTKNNFLKTSGLGLVVSDSFTAATNVTGGTSGSVTLTGRKLRLNLNR